MTKLVTIIGLSAAINASAQAAETAEFLSSSEAAPLTSQKKEVVMRILTYNEIAEMAKDVIKKLPANVEWKGIVALTRGGLVPAEFIAEHMNIQNLIALNVKSYDEKTQGAMEILNQKSLADGGKDCLVIDDLADTGKTVEKIRTLYPNATIVTLMVKPKGKNTVHHYSADFPQDLWLHYPWEPLAKEGELLNTELPLLSLENTQNMTFETIKKMSKDLMNKLPKREWDGILALTHGGLTPAGIMSQFMGIRRLEILNVNKSGQDTISGAPIIPNEGENWLVIGDFSNAENTAKAIRQVYPKAYITSLMAKPDTKAPIDLFSTELPNHLKPHYPWEIIESINENERKAPAAAVVK